MEIPNTNEWQPKKDYEEWLKTAFIQQCIYSEEVIKSRLELEKKRSFNNLMQGCL